MHLIKNSNDLWSQVCTCKIFHNHINLVKLSKNKAKILTCSSKDTSESSTPQHFPFNDNITHKRFPFHRVLNENTRPGPETQHWHTCLYVFTEPVKIKPVQREHVTFSSSWPHGSHLHTDLTDCRSKNNQQHTCVYVHRHMLHLNAKWCTRNGKVQPIQELIKS